MKHILLLLFCGFVGMANAQPGFLDSSFGDNGKILLNDDNAFFSIDYTYGGNNIAALTNDNKVLVCGTNILKQKPIKICQKKYFSSSLF